jgi:transposase
MGAIILSSLERSELSRWAGKGALRAGEARRARLILLLDSGKTWAHIRERLGCNDAFIDRWSKRYRVQRLAGLRPRRPDRRESRLAAPLEARILLWTAKRTPSDGSVRWSTRKLALQLGVSHMTVARVWRKHDVCPPLRSPGRVRAADRAAPSI